jgi:hypothetical protein
LLCPETDPYSEYGSWIAKNYRKIKDDDVFLAKYGIYVLESESNFWGEMLGPGSESYTMNNPCGVYRYSINLLIYQPE